MVRKKPLTDKHKILSLGEHSILDKKIKRKEEEQKKMPLPRITAKFYPDHKDSCYKHLDKRIIIYDIFTYIQYTQYCFFLDLFKLGTLFL